MCSLLLAVMLWCSWVLFLAMPRTAWQLVPSKPSWPKPRATLAFWRAARSLYTQKNTPAAA